MQLNKFNQMKEIQILMKYKLLNIFRIKIINILLIIMIFIIDNIILKIKLIQNVQLLKWKQEINHQNKYLLINKLNKNILNIIK